MNISSSFFLFISGVSLTFPAAMPTPTCTSTPGWISEHGPSVLLSAIPLEGCISTVKEVCAADGKFLKLKNTSSERPLTWSSQTLKLTGQILEPEASGFEMIPHWNPKSGASVQITVTICK